MDLTFRCVVGCAIAFSFTLFGTYSSSRRLTLPSWKHWGFNTHLPSNLGNAITQSFMSVPALLVNFPKISSGQHRLAAQQLGHQWPVFWQAGNVFFRPISVLGIFGYAYASFEAASAPSARLGDWGLYALAATCHLVTVVHSAVNLQPINAQLQGMSEPEIPRVDIEKTEKLARQWIKLNLVRVLTSFVAGSAALLQSLSNRSV